MKRIIVVGTGFSGSVIARKIAEELNQPVQVIESRPHIAGNMYDEIDEHGILIQRYGPHIVCTNHWKVIDYLSQYATMVPYTVKMRSFIDEKFVRLPFNFETVQQLLGGEKSERVIALLRNNFLGRDRVPVLELVEHENEEIAKFGNLLFDKAYKTYCAKQWDTPVELLDKTIMGRVPMAMNYDERYMNKDFQYLPQGGFTKLFDKILQHPNISLHLCEDATKHIVLDETTKQILYDGQKVDVLVYTGAVDELFCLKYGELPYRSLDIHYEWYDVEQKFPEAITSYPQAEGYTRKTEYKFLMSDISAVSGTVVATEYPIAYVKGGSHAPFYPLLTEKTQQIYESYLLEAERYKDIFLCGRLAEFRYYNMDDCILRAFDVFEKVKKLLYSR